jgi:hypothetical protein
MAYPRGWGDELGVRSCVGFRGLNPTKLKADMGREMQPDAHQRERQLLGVQSEWADDGYGSGTVARLYPSNDSNPAESRPSPAIGP